MRKVKVTVGKEYTVHQPTFRGQHNRIKSLSFLVLYNCKLKNLGDLRLSELAALTGADPNSLHVLLSRWRKWRYVGIADNLRKPHRYFISKRGIKWVKRWAPSGLMPLNQYIAELTKIEIALKQREASSP